MTTFVDRVVLHVAAGDGGHGVRLGPPREVQAARRPGRRQRRPRRRRRSSRRPAGHHAARLPPPPAPQGRPTASPAPATTATAPTAATSCCRCPRAPSSRTADGEVLADLVGAGADVRRRPRRPRRPRQRGAGLGPAQGARLRAARRARRGRRRRARAQVARRRRADRLPERRQVLAWSRRCRRPGPRSPTTRSPRSCPTSASSRPATQRFTVADVPGLIPGASEGKGLGLEFLRHVERCSVLVHVIDCATLEPGRDPISDLDVIEAELAQYVPDETLGGRPLVRAHPDRRAQQGRRARGARAGRDGQARPRGRGLEVLRRLRGGPHRAARADASRWPATSPRPGPSSRPRGDPQRIVLRPKAVDDSGFTVMRENTPDGEVFRIVGERPTRWVRQTDFSNDEAVGYLADRLGPARRRGGAVQGRRRRRGHGAHRPDGQRRRLRLGAHHRRRRRAARRPARHRPAARGRPAPPDPRGQARATTPTAGPPAPRPATSWPPSAAPATGPPPGGRSDAAERRRRGADGRTPRSRRHATAGRDAGHRAAGSWSRSARRSLTDAGGGWT